MSAKRGWTWGGSITVVIAVIGLLWQMSVWSAVGWTTPNQHAADLAEVEADHEAVESTILKALEALQEKSDDNHDEWKCDEYEEELTETLQTRAAVAERGDSTVLLDQLIEKIRKAMDKRNCARFDDFG